MKIDMCKLNKKEAKFYGIYNRFFKLGSNIFKAIEDEQDGYRSSLSHIELIKDHSVSEIDFTLYTSPIKVTIECVQDFIYIKDEDDNVWLRIGTNNHDDYYPSFCFEYTEYDTLKTIEEKLLD